MNNFINNKNFMKKKKKIHKYKFNNNYSLQN